MLLSRMKTLHVHVPLRYTETEQPTKLGRDKELMARHMC